MTNTALGRGVATSVTRDDGAITVVYRGTRVVDVTPRRIILDAGTKKTARVMAVLNNVSAQFNLGYIISKKRGVWWVQHNSVISPFDDARVILEPPNHRVTRPVGPFGQTDRDEHGIHGDSRRRGGTDMSNATANRESQCHGEFSSLSINTIRAHGFEPVEEKE